MKRCIYAQPPDLVAARRDLAAARRETRALAGTLERSGGVELFAAGPGSLSVRLRDAQLWESNCEARVGYLAPGRANLTAVPAIEAPAAQQPETVAPSALPAAPVVTRAQQPEVGLLLGQWQDARAIATDPSRPRGIEPLREQAHAHLLETTRHALAERGALGGLSDAFAAHFSAGAVAAELRLSRQQEAMRQLDDPSHPATVAARSWDAQHPNIDELVAVTWATLDAAVAARALSPGHDFVPALPARISEVDRGTWTLAVATQLAYRDRHAVTGPSPLGDEPWAADQVREWEAARVELARVGVTVHSQAEAAMQIGRLRSLNAALEYRMEIAG